MTDKTAPHQSDMPERFVVPKLSDIAAVVNEAIQETALWSIKKEVSDAA